jgi:hypothetical protein
MQRRAKHGVPLQREGVCERERERERDVGFIRNDTP